MITFPGDEEVHTPPTKGNDTGVEEKEPTKLSISMVCATDFLRATRKVGGQIHTLWLEDHMTLAATSDIQDPDPLSVTPDQYKDFADVFQKKDLDKLPPHRPYDLTIDLQKDEHGNDLLPKPSKIYPLNQEELKVLKEYIDENLKKGFIRPSKAPRPCPILFVKKKSGELRLCHDYRALNRVTKRNGYPLPLIDELLDRVSGAKIFSKIDLRWGYNNVRIREGDEWKAAFSTRYGQYEPLVMGFGFTNTPACFQHFVNDIFRDIMDIYVVIYLDDILIFSKNEVEHEKHVREVLRRLREHQLFANPKKCDWHVKEVNFLGFYISENGIRMDEDKVNAVTAWETPKNVHDIQVFIGFANFYRRFIRQFSHLAKPLTSLLRKDVKFDWTNECEDAFRALKDAFTTAPILQHPNPQEQFWVETDSSDFARGAVLSQKGEDGLLHPVAFMSKSLAPAELNYDIYDKEMLAIVGSFKSWRVYLEGCPKVVIVYSDHKNLEYFTTTKELSCRQARWSEFLSRFDFEIHYCPGSSAGKPDALSRLPQHKTSGGGGKPVGRLLAPEQFIISATDFQEMPIATDTTLAERIKKVYPTDKSLEPILAFLNSDPEQAPQDVRNRMASYSLDQGLLLKDGLIVVPGNDELKRDVVASRHDSLMAGYPGHTANRDLFTH